MMVGSNLYSLWNRLDSYIPLERRGYFHMNFRCGQMRHLLCKEFECAPLENSTRQATLSTDQLRIASLES